MEVSKWCIYGVLAIHEFKFSFRSSMHRSSSLHSSTQSRDSKCRSTYDNYGPVIETSEPSISSSNEFLESEPPLTSINESKTDLDRISSSSNDNIKPISSSISSKPSITTSTSHRVDSERYFQIFGEF